MKENDQLRTRLADLQKLFEEKEGELIKEINTLLIQINESRPRSGIDYNSVRKMVENVKLQSELRYKTTPFLTFRNRDILIDQILQVLSEDKTEQKTADNKSRDSLNNGGSRFNGTRGSFNKSNS